MCYNLLKLQYEALQRTRQIPIDDLVSQMEFCLRATIGTVLGEGVHCVQGQGTRITNLKHAVHYTQP